MIKLNASNTTFVNGFSFESLLDTNFFIDFPTIITFIIAIYFSNLRFLEYVSLLRVLRLGSKYIADIEENFNLQENWGGENLSLLKLVFFIIFSGHLIACMWVSVGRMNYYSWMDDLEIADEAWHQIYITSYYWAVVTMITVGYGDIVPQNPTERFFAMLIMIFTCASFAYCLNAISTIFSDMNKATKDYRRQISKINVFMSQRSIPDNLQRKIRRQLEYVYQEKRRGRLSTDQVLDGLSKTLQNEIMIAVNIKIIQKIGFLTENFSKDFLERMCLIIKDTSIGPEDYIYKQYDINDFALYFIESGQVELLMEGAKNLQKTTLIANIKSGQWFGDYSFFSDQARETSARSYGVTYLNYIKKSDLNELFKEFPD